MVEYNITRFNPREDFDALKALVKEFEYKRLLPIDIEKCEKEISTRVLDLKLRNSIVIAKGKEDGTLLGAGFFTVWVDYLGEEHCHVHHVVIRKEHAFKHKIEETIYRELFKYIKNTMNIDKIDMLISKKDTNFKSLLMKMKIKKHPELEYYEYEIE